MIVLFQLIVLTTIWNLGIEIIFSDGMALEKVRKWAESKNNKWFEPLITCVWCRPSIHSVIVFLVACGLGIIEWDSWNNAILYPFVVAGTSLLSGVIWSIYKLIEIKIKYYQHKEQNEYFDLKNRKQSYFNNKK